MDCLDTQELERKGLPPKAMICRLMLALVLCVMFSVNGFADDASTYKYTWRNMPDEAKVGFAAGVLQALITNTPPLDHSDDQLAKDMKVMFVFASCANKMSPHVLRALIDQYVEQHPDDAKQLPLGRIAMNALDPLCFPQP